MAVRNTPFWVLQAPTLLLWATIATMTMTSTTVGAEIDPGADFSGYMDDLKKKEEAAEKHRNLVNEHEIWRQTTWGGFVVRQLQAVGNHFAPFFEAMADLVEGSATEETPVFGRDIVVEEEIIIEEDEDDANADDERKDEGKKDR